MGFAPSPKELSDDPPILEVLAISKIEQRERLALQALSSSSSEFVPGGRELAMSLPGAGPYGFFDPLDITPENQRLVILWREAELTHCRVSMLAVIGFVFAEKHWVPFMPDMDTAPLAIDQVKQIPFPLVVALLFGTFLAETHRGLRGWASEPGRTMNPNYSPGDLGFDPLKLLPSDVNKRSDMLAKELNNGRYVLHPASNMPDALAHQRKPVGERMTPRTTNCLRLAR